MFDDSRYRRSLPRLGGHRSILVRLGLAYIGAYTPTGPTADGDSTGYPGTTPANTPVPSSFWMF